MVSASLRLAASTASSGSLRLGDGFGGRREWRVPSPRQIPAIARRSRTSIERLWPCQTTPNRNGRRSRRCAWQDESRTSTRDSKNSWVGISSTQMPWTSWHAGSSHVATILSERSSTRNLHCGFGVPRSSLDQEVSISRLRFEGTGPFQHQLPGLLTDHIPCAAERGSNPQSPHQEREKENHDRF